MRAPILSAVAVVLMSCVHGPGADPSLPPLPSEPSAVVISSDYLSSSVGFLNDSAEVLIPRWLHSGTTAPGLSTALSGDVVLPTEAPPPGELLLIDRLGVDLITRIAVPGGVVLGQHATAAGFPGQAAFRSNPHDAIYLSASRLLVSRFEPNIAPDAPRLNRGNDLIEIDLLTNTIVRRIDFGELDQNLAGRRLYARPSRMVSRGADLLVGLGRLSLDFRHTGAGAVAFLPRDLSQAPTAFPLPEASGCSHVAPVPGVETLALVTCTGPSFSDETTRRSGAAIFIIDTLSRSLIHAHRAPVDEAAPAVMAGALALSPTQALAIGSNVDGMQSAYLVDFESNLQTPLLQAERPFTLGVPSYRDGELLIPDAARGAIVRFEVQPRGDLTRRPDLPLSPGPALKPREIQHLFR